LKGAYINAEIYIGDDQLDALATIKSREELIGNLLLTSGTSTELFLHFKINSLKLRLLKLRQRHNIKFAQFMLFTMHNKQNIILNHFKTIEKGRFETIRGTIS
jgi:hypothetical protein